ncbi:putative lipoyltransferase 2, mitochondrial [Podila clonocystis]|nr:putative lipoyltransferase 2, mitochondrial [Podila clonocystis]
MLQTSLEASTTATSTGPLCPSQIPRPRLPPLPYIYLRDLPYNRGSDLQQFLVDRQIRLRKEREDKRTVGADDTQKSADLSEEGSHDLLLIVEHTPTYTNGRRNRGAQAISDKEADRLKKLGATYVESLRGGEITYHGPGQLVAYPILDLKPIKLSVRCYVSYLEKAIIATCAEWGVKAMTTENTGVWLNDQQKIAAIGVHVQRYITSHGLALNCNTDLEYFNQIVACGLSGKETTSLSKELADPSINVAKVIPTFVSGFGKVFERSLVPLADKDKALEQAVLEYCQTGDFAKLKEL